MRSWCYGITINLLWEGRLQYVCIDHKRVVLAVGRSHVPLLRVTMSQEHSLIKYRYLDP